MVVALGIAIRDGRLIRSEREYHEAPQARSVVSEVPTPDLVRISNHSREPILVARITGVSARMTRGNGEVEHYLGKAEPDLNGVVAPGSSWETSIELVDVVNPGRTLQPNHGVDDWQISVTFQILDSEGQAWQRTDNGRPVKVND
ncbi:hypothetical protein [Streptomyces diastatochromogenes]|uniref:hypothetical protein n=1 Tax=Streptomyces diastatochromogenes TaxID=42236 RepID=UPI00117E5875|nr:hypothetical protein [Streptomyces diastatochromogenes]MCZ0990352.1 hypothetical protein [Streptomyces diastatochromogenes]